MNGEHSHHSDEERELQALFDATALLPENEQIDRLTHHATGIPEQALARRWWRQLLRPSLWIPAGALGILALLLVPELLQPTQSPKGMQVLSAHRAPVVTAVDATPIPDSWLNGLNLLDPMSELDGFDSNDMDLMAALDPVYSIATDAEKMIWSEVYDDMLANDF